MTRRRFRVWLACALAALWVAPLPIARARDAIELPATLQLYVGESRSIVAAPRRMAVGNGRIVSVTPVDAGHLLLLGEAPGSTTLQLWLDGGEEVRIEVQVSAANVTQTLREVQELLSGTTGLSARVAAGRVILEGEGLDTAARARAAAVTALYPGLVVDFTDRLGHEATVLIDARIVELRRGSLRDLGVRWRGNVNGPNAGIIADVVVNDLYRPVPPESPQAPGAPPPAGRVWPPRGYLGWSALLDSRLSLLEQRGDLAVLAEPSLACRSGGAARFVSGGEFPIPVLNANGAADVEFKEYGVILDVRPVIDATGAVQARVETEISQIDASQTVMGVPGLLKRRSATDITLQPGETLVLAGLVSQIDSHDRQAVPGLGRLPIAGRAFRGDARRRERTELAIFLTPRLISAAPRDDAAQPGSAPRWTQPSIDSLERRRREIAGEGP